MLQTLYACSRPQSCQAVSLYKPRNIGCSCPTISPKKLGQNFLVDDAARHAIADALGDISQRTVIEIGPGHGAITDILAGRARTPHRPGARPRPRRRADLPLPRQSQCSDRRDQISSKPTSAPLIPAGENADVIGNLPYYITSDILLKLFAAGSAGLIAARRPDDAARGRRTRRRFARQYATTACSPPPRR